MKCTTVIRKKFVPLLLAPVIAGMLVAGMPLPAKAQVALPTFPIETPADAKTWGLDSLGNLMRSPSGDYSVQPLVLNNSFKVPLPSNLGAFVKDRKAALVLGKALFWDMQVGSDGIQACATCHFQAGADVRTKNQVATQGNQVKFQRDGDIKGFFFANKTGSDQFETVDGVTWEPNFPLDGADFPLVLTQNAFVEDAGIIKADTDAGNRNDVVGSMGVMPAQFGGVTPGSPVDNYTGTLGTMRPTTGRNAPAAVNAVFNLLQFWDGRADTKFNGVNPIGRHDTSNPVYYVNVSSSNSNTLKAKTLQMQVASLASQSVGPPLSDVEMSFAGRKWPDIGKKLTRVEVTPLAYQRVSGSDSVLGPYVNGTGMGLNKSYKALVKAAFKDNLWNNTNQAVSLSKAKLVKTSSDEVIMLQGATTVATLPTDTKGKPLPPDLGQYTQMEANFSLFWGIAVMLYEAELVSEQSTFDKWMEGTGDLTAAELDGLNVFVNQGKCIACHSGPEFTNATVRNTKNGREQIEPVIKANGDPGFYDNGFYNVGMTPTVDDIQRGDKDPNGKPWGNARQFLFQKKGIMNIPFEIIGLPISADLKTGICTLDSKNICEPDTFVEGTPVIGGQVFKVDPLGIIPPFLVCIDANGDGKCGLNDNIKIQTLDQDGNCKAPTVRNVELNGPYFHNGGAATIQQILDNYDIGGKFRTAILNKVDMLPDITRLGLEGVSTPNGTNAEEALVAFILALTDHRVKTEKKPFDHPQLFLPIDGTAPMLDAAAGDGTPAAWNKWLVDQAAAGKFEEDAATGAGGLSALGLDPLQPFHAGLGINQATGEPITHFDGNTGKGSIIEVGSD